MKKRSAPELPRSDRVKVSHGVRSTALKKPYHLSFATLTEYDSVWVYAQKQNGEAGLAEAIALPGYGWETTDSISATIQEVIGAADFHDCAELLSRCSEIRGRHPFAASAIVTALEIPSALRRSYGAAFPVNAPLSGEGALDVLRAQADTQLAAGFSYLKVKVGQFLTHNIAAARCLLQEWPEHDFKVLFDANQGFSRDDALRFAEALACFGSSRLLWFEQPVDRDDWASMEAICAAAKVPILLDECIYDEADVARAAAIGASGIKLKLFKNFGITETVRLARLARDLNLIVVFGNGVATDIGNLGEYLTLAANAHLFAAPAECNGFHKLRQPILGDVLDINGSGEIICLLSESDLRARIRAFGRSVGLEASLQA